MAGDVYATSITPICHFLPRVLTTYSSIAIGVSLYIENCTTFAYLV